MSWQHFCLGVNEGGVENWVSVNDDGELVTRDVQRGATIKIILDECAEMRARVGNMPPNMLNGSQGYIAAKVPITMWQNWRRDWQENWSDVYTWQEYEVRRLNSRDFHGFKCIPGEIHVPKHVAEGGL